MLKSFWIGTFLVFFPLKLYSQEVHPAKNKTIETKSTDSQSIDNPGVPPVTKKEEKATVEELKAEQTQSIQNASKELFGNDSSNKFSLYQPSYFIFGKENLKMQFSAKYKVAKTYNLFLGYTQLMFWNIYDSSAPFDDINYNPEVFYRIIEDQNNFLRSIDIGMLHTSNGEDGDKSRSINRIFVKTNFATSIGKHNILGELKIQDIFGKSSFNNDIVDYMGYWELKMIFTHFVTWGSSRIDLQYKLNAGKKIFNIEKGGRELGILYNLGSENFNPTFYVQYYSGYAESLLHYNKKVSQVRGGLLLYF
ncbi:MAG: phospholipase A [Rhizobacter sp.]|nr:phospholipase A [Bacteriovorax sp.]